MPILKFETKLVNGKPNIVFETELQKQISKKRDYKTKVQKFPIRHIGNDEIKDSENNIEVVNNSISANQRKQKPTERFKLIKNPQSPTPNRNYENDMFGSSNKRPVANSSNKTQSKSQKESLFNFLKNDVKEPVHKINEKSINNGKPRVPRKKSLSDDDIDEIMRQVVQENKSVLSDDQLVDLLAKIYIEAKGGSQGSAPESSRKNASDTRERELKGVRYARDNSDIAQTNNSQERHNVVPALEFDEPEKKFALATAPATASLTIAQKKQLQWDQERQELAKITSYNPWGRPGCGAPIKDPYEIIIPESHQSNVNDTRPPVDSHRYAPSGRTPEPTGLSQAEIKRRQWVEELNEQVAERERLKYKKDHPTSNQIDQYDNKSSSIPTGDMDSGHGRGKGLANLSQITNEEMSLKRHKQMEQQEAIKRQIEEKELLKRLEREKKALLDQQEEMRINKEKQHIDTQFVNETARAKQREDESGRRFAQLRNQVEEAERAALLDKRMKRLQHLEMAGHDTRQLRAGLVADQMSGRLAASTEFLTEENSFTKMQQAKMGSRHNYDTTPRPRYAVTEDHGIQTDVEEKYERNYSGNFDSHRTHKIQRNRSFEDDRKPPAGTRTKERDNKFETNKHEKKHFKVASATVMKQEEKPRSKRPESIGSRKPWGVKKINKQYVPQSKRDPFYSNTKDVRENNKNDRVNQILAQVKANMDRIPDTDAGKGHLSERHRRCDDRHMYDQDKENIAVNQGTYDLKEGDYFHPEDDGDRVQASVRYKDSYRQPGNQKSQRDQRNTTTHKPHRSPEHKEIMWDDYDHEIVRTTDVLDPSTADQRCLVSREDTGRERARNSYFKSQNPGQLGDSSDKQYDAYKPHHGDQNKRDPLNYQQGHPTNRQNTILKQLSEIRADLRMRQKDIETSLSMNDDM